MSRYEHGRVLAVNETTLGSELVADHAAGVSSLTVEDPVDFDEDGGWLSINGQVIEYSTFDDDTGEITLTAPLDGDAQEGDRVDLWDRLWQVVTVDKVAQVELDGDDENADPLEALIPLHLLDDMPEGIRGVRGESVLLELDGDEWRIVDILGLATAAAGGAVDFWDQDVLEVTDPGDQLVTLTHTPLPGSLHMRWNELPQEPTEYGVSGRFVDVPDPGGLLLPGDRLWFMYAYNPAAEAIDAQPDAPSDPEPPPPGVEPALDGCIVYSVTPEYVNKSFGTYTRWVENVTVTYSIAASHTQAEWIAIYGFTAAEAAAGTTRVWEQVFVSPGESGSYTIEAFRIVSGPNGAAPNPDGQSVAFMAGIMTAQSDLKPSNPEFHYWRF